MTPATSTTTPAVIYRRVSTDDQAASGLGLEAQYDTCEKHAATRGWSPVAVFTDAGVSGTIPLAARPAGAQAVELARALGAVLLVAKMDRVGRDSVDRITLIRSSADEGWRIESPDMAGVDGTTPEGKMIHGVMATFAEYERELTRARTRAALRAKIRRGERVGMPPQVDPAAVARAIALRGEGMGYAAIAARLDEEGYTPPRAARWHRKTVSHMVTGEPWGAVTKEIRKEARA
jgi:DNA invertase Pin-like site-specific DNA recombinase